jgi:transcriptional regulator with XRE-family HTH domain
VPPPTIGDNVKTRRIHCGLTQEALAEAAGLSVETVRKLEQNKNIPRMSTLNKLARALDTPTSRLLGNAADSAAKRQSDHDEIEIALMPLRQVLTPARGIGGVVVGSPEVAPPALSDVRESIRSVDRAYHDDDYAVTLAALPTLLSETLAAVDATTGNGRGEALALRAQAHQVAAIALIQLRCFDLAYHALNQALRAAEASGEQLASASVLIEMCWLLLRQGRFGEAEQLAVKTADAIEPKFSRVEPVRLQTWGWLMLHAAASAVRDNRPGDANELLDAAGAAAVRLGDRRPPEAPAPGVTTISALDVATVAMKRVEAAVVAGDVGRALELAERVEPGGPHGQATSNNRNRHLLDVAFAQVQRGALVGAEETLLVIRSSAPTWLRHQRFARDIVDQMRSAKKRKISQDLSALAELVGLEE